jgi:hypothetical protein
MSLTHLTYVAPIRHGTRPRRPDYEQLEAAVALNDEGKHLEAIHKAFAHLFVDVQVPDLSTQAFEFTQGSSKVTAKIEGDDLVIAVPLVRLPDGGRAIAALRFVLTKLAANGQLHQPRLRGDDIYLEYRDRVARMHPAKVIEVLKRMPMQADANDDWLIGQFGALPLERADLGQLDAAELARADTIWTDHWHEVEELSKESQRKRSIFFLNEVTAYAVHRLNFALPLTGFVGSKLAEAAATFNDGQGDPDKREASMAKAIKEFKAVSPDELHKSLGHATYAISPLAEGTPKVLSGYFSGGNYIETIDRYRKSDKQIDAALALMCTYNFLLARYSWPEPVEQALEDGLAKSSGKAWREAADVMWHHAHELVNQFGEDEEEGDGDGEEGEDDGDGAGEEDGGQS